MSYFDAVACGRFKRVNNQWAFYPWGEREGYLLPAREDYWRMHAWTSQILKVWVLLTLGVWMMVGPVSVPLVAVPLLAWYRRRLRTVLAGLPRTAIRLGHLESYQARGEAHSWQSLWITAGVSVLAISAAVAIAARDADLRLSSLLLGAWFAILLAGAVVMILSKSRSDRKAASPHAV